MVDSEGHKYSFILQPVTQEGDYALICVKENFKFSYQENLNDSICGVNIATEIRCYYDFKSKKLIDDQDANCEKLTIKQKREKKILIIF